MAQLFVENALYAARIIDYSDLELEITLKEIGMKIGDRREFSNAINTYKTKITPKKSIIE